MATVNIKSYHQSSGDALHNTSYSGGSGAATQALKALQDRVRELESANLELQERAHYAEQTCMQLQ
jgi:hypothetical protein